jgi:hypothetical protein
MTRRAIGTIALASLVVLAAGCADGDGDTAGDSTTTVAGASEVGPPDEAGDPGRAGPVDDEPSDPTAVEPEAPPPSDGGPAVAPTPVEPAPAGGETRRTPVDHIVSDPESAVVEVWFWNAAGPCGVLDRVEVEESRTEVRLTVITGSQGVGAADEACPRRDELQSTTVTLAAPLGARTVVDAGTR